jgi:hypothetical protein
MVIYNWCSCRFKLLHSLYSFCFCVQYAYNFLYFTTFSVGLLNADLSDGFALFIIYVCSDVSLE